MTALRKKEWKALTQLLNEWRLTNFTRSFNTHQLKRQDFKTKNMAASLYLANVYQTGTYSKMLEKLILKKLHIQKSKHLSHTTSLINRQSNSKKINDYKQTLLLILSYFSTAFYRSQCLFYLYPSQSFSFPFSYLSFLLPFLLSSSIQELDLILKALF